MPATLAGEASALIVAHPGHELLLHRWLERSRPLVYALTDGSGSDGASRSRYSRDVVRAAGATVGSVFGAASDREWYRAILDRDAAPFAEAVDRISDECIENRVEAVVTDAVEHFNPMHDLCAVVAGSVARRVSVAGGREVALFEYAIESAPPQASPDVLIVLDDEALERKRVAAAAIPPLAAEVARHDAAEGLARETLHRVTRAASRWPDRLPEEAHYERHGRRRIQAGRYQQLITYAEHVRPLALALAAI